MKPSVCLGMPGCDLRANFTNHLLLPAATGRAEYESLLSRHNETLKLMMENSAKSGASSASGDKAGQLTVGIPPARPRRRSSVGGLPCAVLRR